MFQGSYPQLFLEKFKKDLTLFFFVYIKNGRNELIENKRGKIWDSLISCLVLHQNVQKAKQEVMKMPQETVMLAIEN